MRCVLLLLIGLLALDGRAASSKALLSAAHRRNAGATNITGLITWWKFNEGSGTFTADSIGSATGTLVSSPVWTNGVGSSGALRFTGANYVSTDVASPITGNAFTVSAWVNPKNGTRADIINSWSTGAAVSNQFDLIVNITTNRAKLYISNGASIPGDSGTNGTINLVQDTWYSITGCWTGTSAHMFVNGISQSSNTFTTTIPVNGRTIRIGNNLSGDGGANAIVDSIRIYNRALSPGEIQYINDNPQ
jgi:hypothetical protein